MADELSEAEVTTEAETTPEATPETTPETTPEATQKPPETTQKDWREAITDADVRKYVDQFTDPGKLAKVAYDQRRQLSNAIIPPGKDATPEQIAAYQERIGVPKEYEFALPEGHEATETDTAFQKKAAEVFRANNITGEQAKALNGFWNEAQAEVLSEMARQTEANRAAQEDALRKDWGSDFDKNREIAAEAWNTFSGTPELAELKLEDGTRVADYPGFVKMFAEVGRKIMPGTIQGRSEEQVQSLKDKYQETMRESITALDRGDRTKAQRLDAEAQKLAQQIWPDAA